MHLTRRHYGFSGFNVSPAAAQVNGVVRRQVTVPLDLRVLVELSFGIPDWPGGGQVSTEELVERLRRHFPAMLIDREKGIAFVQRQLDTLIAMRVPDVILRSHKGCRDHTIYVSISEPNWLGGTATSYVKAIRNPALEGVDFVVTSIADEATQNRITRELACALDMALCSEINWETGGLLQESVKGRAEPRAAPDLPSDF